MQDDRPALRKAQSSVMIDEWNERLQCPRCSNKGMASLSQEPDADIPSVTAVPEGFKVVSDRYGPAFHCTPCGVEVNP